MPARKWWLLVPVALCVLWFYFLRQPRFTVEELAGRLPHTDRIVVRIDVDSLRRGGLLDRLAGKAGVEEADYQQFVSGTGFDYRKDLDAVLASYSAQETHFFLTGRFDWRRLQDYASKQGGQCSRGACRLDSSTPGRRISFTRLNATTLALASSSDSDAVRRLDSKADPLAALPSDPVWILLPSAVLKAKDGLPAGTRSFASAVEDAERVTLGIGPKDNRFEARLEANFQSDSPAAAAQKHLQNATELLNKMMARDKLSPNPRNLTGVLSGGRFHTEGAVLKGTWPVESAFLE